MIVDFNGLNEVRIPHMNGGDGEVIAKMTVNYVGRFIECIIPPNSSIGPHLQESNDDINFIVGGEGIAVCNGIEEILKPGVCHVCPKGSTHSIKNTGKTDLIFYTVVPK